MEEGAEGEEEVSTENTGQHLLGECSWWISKELVEPVSYQMPHSSIFRNF